VVAGRCLLPHATPSKQVATRAHMAPNSVVMFKRAFIVIIIIIIIIFASHTH
jgi:hypothetical protein